MSQSLISSYESLSTSSSRNDVTCVLQSIVDASPLALTTSGREQLVQTLLDDVQQCLSNGKGGGRLSKPDLQAALLAIKTLGRTAAVSQILSTENNLSTLLHVAKSLESSDSKASHEALRCSANALLLVAEGRTTWVDIRGADYCIELLETADSPTVIFLASRMLFLVTVSSSSPIVTTLFTTQPSSPTPIYDMRSTSGSKRHDIVETIGNRLDFLLTAILQSVPMSKEAMTDLLKFTFNLLVHWPKMADGIQDSPKGKSKGKGKDKTLKKPIIIEKSPEEDRKLMGEIWTERLDDILPPLLRIFLGLPTTVPSPLSAPLTHVLHALIAIPIQGKHYRTWFPELAAPPRPSSSSSSRVSSTTNSPPSARATSPLPPTSRSGSPSASSSKEKEPKEKDSRGALDRALSRLPRISLSADRNSWYGGSAAPVPSTSSRSNSTSVSSWISNNNPTSQTSPVTQPKVLIRAADLLEVSLNHYLPGDIDPDDKSVRERCTREDVQMDDVLSPLVVLLTRMCQASEECRRILKLRIIPLDIDRTSPLEGRADTLGRCIRLLPSAYHSRLKVAVGELLLACCDSDAQTLSIQIGYGNAAGFLYNKGLMAAPPPPTQTSDPSNDVGADVDPITGMIKKEKAPLPEMTEEEKEIEAEKLFVLFDRLEKSGGGENPIRKAMREGKLEKYGEQGKDGSDSE